MSTNQSNKFLPKLQLCAPETSCERIYSVSIFTHDSIYLLFSFDAVAAIIG